VRESTKTADKRLAKQIYSKRKGELFSEVVVKCRKSIKVERAIALFRKARTGTVGEDSLEVKMRVFAKFDAQAAARVAEAATAQENAKIYGVPVT
jgi:hypothetical protein